MLSLKQHSLSIATPHYQGSLEEPLDSDGISGHKQPRIGTPRGVLEGAQRQQSSVTDPASESEVNDSGSAQSQREKGRMEKEGEVQQGGRGGQENRPPPGHEMTPEQIETLRRQVAVYCGICDNLMALHRQKMSGNQGPLQGMDAYYQDSNALMSRGGKHRWAPAEAQKAALDRVYNELGGATPSKARIKELVAELSRHGPVTESNIYNWFQNKKARSKRKSAATEAESSIDDRNPKRMREDGAHSSGSLNMSSFDVDRMSEGGVSSGFEQRPGPPQQMQAPLSWRGSALTPELPPAARSHLFADASIQDAAAMLLYAAAESASQGGGVQTFANTLGMLGANNEAGFFNPGGQGGLERNLGGGLELPYGTLGGESSYNQTPAEPSLKVMINGRPYDVPAGPLDVRASFGEGMVLYDSRGVQVLTDSLGVTFDALQDGETYFLQNELQPGLGLDAERLGRSLFP